MIYDPPDYEVLLDEADEQLEEIYDAVNSYMEYLGTLWRIAISQGNKEEIQRAEEAHEIARKMLILGANSDTR